MYCASGNRTKAATAVGYSQVRASATACDLLCDWTATARIARRFRASPQGLRSFRKGLKERRTTRQLFLLFLFLGRRLFCCWLKLGVKGLAQCLLLGRRDLLWSIVACYLHEVVNPPVQFCVCESFDIPIPD